jgi:hypothetical protein
MVGQRDLPAARAIRPGTSILQFAQLCDFLPFPFHALPLFASSAAPP